MTNNNNNSTTSVNTNNNINTGTMTYNNNNVSTSTNVNTNNNINSGTMTYNNNNVNTSTSNNVNTNNNINSGKMEYVNTNTNINTGTQTNVNQNTNTNTNINTGDMTNRNINTSTVNAVNQNSNVSTNTNIQSGDMTNRNINTTDITQRVIQPPPTAMAPAMMSGGNNDLCSTGTSGSVQTQIFGVSSGGTVRDMNCERLKLSKTLYDMGMKVAAVATMCQDKRVFDAMLAAGTPCPIDGKIGEAAKVAWEDSPDRKPKPDEEKLDETYKKVGIGAILGALVFKLF
jgi:hypothetical protein